MFLSLLAASLLFAQQTPSPSALIAATDQARTDAAAEQNADRAQQSRERRVCRRVREVGSNRSERVCTTVAEDREMRELSREFIDRSNDPSERATFGEGHSLAGPGGSL